MRALALAFAILLLPATAAAADISAACYSDCESRTTSNPEYKACLARAADAPDVELNRAYTALKAAIGRFAKEMGLSRRQLHLQGPACLRGHLDRRQLFGLPVRSEPGTGARLRPHHQAPDPNRLETTGKWTPKRPNAA